MSKPISGNVTLGTNYPNQEKNILGENQGESILLAAKSILESGGKKRAILDLFDSKASSRIVKIIIFWTLSS